MKNKRNTFFKTIFKMIVVFAIICTTNLNAQIPPEGQTTTPDSLPLDGGLIALVLGAVAFGVKKLYDNKNDKA